MVYTVQYKPTPNRLAQLTEQKADKEEQKAFVKKNKGEDAQLPSKFMDHLPAFWICSRHLSACGMDIRGVLP